MPVPRANHPIWKLLHGVLVLILLAMILAFIDRNGLDLSVDVWKFLLIIAAYFTSPAAVGGLIDWFKSRGAKSVMLWAALMLPTAEAIAQPQAPRKYLFEVKRVVDGDTLAGTLRLPYGISLDGTVRASNYDCWESRSTRTSVGEISKVEIARGKRATADLEEYLKGKRVFVEPTGESQAGLRDKYGRLLGIIYVVQDDHFVDLREWAEKSGNIRKRENE